jgi:hypothetical protein
MKTVSLILVVLLSMGSLASAQIVDTSPVDAKPLPTMDVLLQQIVNRAVSKEGNNDNLFDVNYQYNRIRTWEYRNSRGELKHTKEKSSVENKPLRITAKSGKQSSMNKPALIPNESDTDSNPSPAALRLKEYSIPDLVKRFQFTLVGRETLNGRPSFVVDFKPASDDLPVKSFADNFINKTAGRVWVDEEDFAVAQAQLHLTEQVNVLGGLVGPVWRFNSEFTRLRTPEGYWFARNLDWHLEGRAVMVKLIVDYHERKLNEQKIVSTVL